jgi:hypothetical protein
MWEIQPFRCYNWVFWLQSIPFHLSLILEIWSNNAPDDFLWTEKCLSPFGRDMEVEVWFCIWFDCLWEWVSPLVFWPLNSYSNATMMIFVTCSLFQCHAQNMQLRL